jgi:hypothetical protein
VRSFLKGFVFLLVLANVGYFLYSRGVAAPPPPPAASTATGSLKLVAGPPASIAPSASSRCVSIGPFSELAESAHAQATLRGGGYAPRPRPAEVEILDGTLVYLPLPATPAATALLLKKLKTAGITDAASVPGPDDAAVVSLGYFSEAQRAQSRVAQAQKLGLSAQIHERRHGGTAYWLDVDLKPGDGPLNPADFHSDTAHGAQLEVTDCRPAPGPADAGATAPGAPDASSAANPAASSAASSAAGSVR